MTSFTTSEIINAINNGSLPKEAISVLLYFFESDEELTYSYKNDNIEDFILETLSEITE